MQLPEGLKYWTADQVAECLSYEDTNGELYGKLWGFLNVADNPTPQGGEDNETPDCLLDLDNDDKADHWWLKLSETEQANIAHAYEQEF